MADKLSKSNILEIAYLFILCIILLWAINGNMYSHKIVHDMPYSYFATDAFAYLTLTEYVQDTGSQLYHPSHQALGHEDVVWLHGIHLSAISVMISSLTNIPVHDTIFLMLAFFIILNCMLVYFLIRRTSIHLAIISSAFFILIATKNFYITYLWGQGGAIPGMLFLTLFIWVITTKRFNDSVLLYTICFSTLILAHLPELMFATIIAFFILIFEYFENKDIKEVIKKIKTIATGLLISILLCIYYLISFYFGSYTTNVARESGGLPIFSPISTSSFPNVALFTDFGNLLIILICIGVVLALYFIFIEKKNSLYIALLILFVLSFGNYFGIGNRAFHIRQFWPLYLSLFLGLTIYFTYKKILIKQNLIISLIISLGLLFALYQNFYTPISGPGAIVKEQYDAFTWIEKNTDENSEIYLLYGDGYSQSARIIKRNIFNVQMDDYATTLNTGLIKRNYTAEHMILGVGNLFYWKSFLKYGYHFDEYGGTTFINPDICSFDYYLIDQKSAYIPQLINLNLYLRNEFLNNNMTEVYNNNYVSILKNNGKGGNCIGSTSQ